MEKKSYRLDALESRWPSQKIIISSPSPRVDDRESEAVENVESRIPVEPGEVHGRKLALTRSEMGEDMRSSPASEIAIDLKTGSGPPTMVEDAEYSEAERNGLEDRLLVVDFGVEEGPNEISSSSVMNGLSRSFGLDCLLVVATCLVVVSLSLPLALSLSESDTKLLSPRGERTISRCRVFPPAEAASSRRCDFDRLIELEL